MYDDISFDSEPPVSPAENYSPLDNMTIKGWERDRALREEAEKITADALLPRVETDPREIECLESRLTAGLGVQLLWNRETGSTFITVTLNGETETFPVDEDKALEAFEHPFAFGATLPL